MLFGETDSQTYAGLMMRVKKKEEACVVRFREKLGNLDKTR
jgi:hypothetical protein